MNRLYNVNIPIPESQKIKEYDPIIPNNISLYYKTFKACKPMYNI